MRVNQEFVHSGGLMIEGTGWSPENLVGSRVTVTGLNLHGTIEAKAYRINKGHTHTTRGKKDEEVHNFTLELTPLEEKHENAN